MYEYTTYEQAADITRVKVDLPNPLRWVNSYLVKGDNGYTLIDPGMHTAEAEISWPETLRELKIGYKDIERIVLTHYHPDHYGLSGWFQEQTGAPVWISEKGKQVIARLWGGEGGQTESRDFLETFYERHGLSGELKELLLGHLLTFRDEIVPQPNLTTIVAGEPIRIGNRFYETMETRGHAEGHLVFLDREREIILCGDQVLERISPNIGYTPGGDPDPLGSFIQSLREVADLPVRFAYPGHVDPFADFAGRANELILHHRERLDHLKEGLVVPITTYEACLHLFGHRELTVHQLYFALSETLAHLTYLVRRGEAREWANADERIVFELAK